jgi:hypothetical protein
MWPNPDDWKRYTPSPDDWSLTPAHKIQVVTLDPFTPAERDKIKAFLKLIEDAKRLDVLADQPDCPDPEKVEWLNKLEERLVAIEAVLDRISERKK